MQKNVTLCTCDRFGHNFYDEHVSVDSYYIMTDEEKEKFNNREQLHEVSGADLCEKCYDEYKTILKEFMERGKEE